MALSFSTHVRNTLCSSKCHSHGRAQSQPPVPQFTALGSSRGRQEENSWFPVQSRSGPVVRSVAEERRGQSWGGEDWDAEWDEEWEQAKEGSKEAEELEALRELERNQWKEGGREVKDKPWHKEVHAMEWDLQQDDDSAEWEGDWEAGEYDDADDEENDKGKAKGRGLPPEMRYFDTAKICVKGGDGGKGCVAFRREKHVPYGGPWGGNGGDGGNIIIQCGGAGLSSLQHFRTHVHYRATKGRNGGGNRKDGVTGNDVIVNVPKGTIVKKSETGETLCEITKSGERYVLVEGGRGGRGNASFKRGQNKAPTIAEFGEEGQEMWVDLELKLVADVGIVGVPNAGKSTLLSVLSNAKPKVANYPFTTLVPNLGVYEKDFQSTVIADIPGILEGAHTGRGLGREFLRHCERTRVLIHLIDGTSPDPLGDYEAINTELLLFNEDLAEKPQIVVINKMDLPDAVAAWDELSAALQDRGVTALQLSGATNQGTKELMIHVHQALQELPEPESEPEFESALASKVHKRKKRGQDRFDEFQVVADRDVGVYFLKGAALERFAQMTNWDYYESITRFQKVLKACGAQEALEEAGVKAGDTVIIGNVDLEWSNDTERDILDSWASETTGVSQGSKHWPQPARCL